MTETQPEPTTTPADVPPAVRDGHVLRLALTDCGIEGVVVCPHTVPPGTAWEDAPRCHRDALEDGTPVTVLDYCMVHEWWDCDGTDVLTAVDPFQIDQVPVHVEYWWAAGRYLKLRPYVPAQEAAS